MPWPAAARRAWLQALAWLLLALALAGPARALEAVVLGDGPDLLPVAGAQAGVWLDPAGTATPQQVLAAGGPWRTLDPDAVWSPGAGALWVRLDLAMAPTEARGWFLLLPNPLLDEAVVWQRGAGGRWQALRAGDTVAYASRAEPGRYPAFRLQLKPGEPAAPVLLQLRSRTPMSVQLQLATETAWAARAHVESVLLGMALGALALLMGASLARSIAYRDMVYALYAAYVGTSALAIAAYTGVAAQLLWPTATDWADQASGTFALLAIGAGGLFARVLLGLPARHARLNTALRAAGFAALPLAWAWTVVPREPALNVLSGYLVLMASAALATAWLTWRRGDRVGLWVMVAFLPTVVAVGVIAARYMGWLPISFLTLYAVVLALLVEVPLLLIALSIRSRDRHAAQIREQALSNQDALTGLLAPHIFEDRLRQALLRFRRDREDCAVVFIDLVNHDRIRAVHGPAVAEQSLLRSVIKMRRVVRDVDTLGRIGEARFGLILDGVGARTAVTERAARLIAAGLMPLPGLKPEVTLQFHMAAVVLRERLLEADALHRELADLLRGMSPRTRRPIRFVKPEVTQPLELDSELPEQVAA